MRDLPKESKTWDEKGINRIKSYRCSDLSERAFCPLTHTQATISKPVTVALLSSISRLMRRHYRQ